MTTWRTRGIRLPEGTEIDAGITDTGAWTATPPDGGEPLPGRYLLPGLVDAHCHLSVGMGPDGFPVPLDLAAARTNLERLEGSGVTGIRDTGSPGGVSLVLRREQPGGELLVCGRFLAPAGQYFPALHQPVAAADLVEAALAEVAAGARWVKLVGDFPVLGPPGHDQPPATPTYPIGPVNQLVQAVHAAGALVAAHTTTRRVSELIAAGVDSVEHGTDLVEDDLFTLAARGAAWTPTLCASIGSPAPDPERERRRQERRDRLGHLLVKAVELGVPVLTGSDVSGSIPTEVALLVELGMAPTAALAAATTAARTFLGLPDLVPGQPADLVTYDADPRDDPETLARPATVFRRGTRLR